MYYTPSLHTDTGLQAVPNPEIQRGHRTIGMLEVLRCCGSAAQVFHSACRLLVGRTLMTDETTPLNAKISDKKSQGVASNIQLRNRAVANDEDEVTVYKGCFAGSSYLSAL